MNLVVASEVLDAWYEYAAAEDPLNYEMGYWGPGVIAAKIALDRINEHWHHWEPDALYEDELLQHEQDEEPVSAIDDFTKRGELLFDPLPLDINEVRDRQNKPQHVVLSRKVKAPPGHVPGGVPHAAQLAHPTKAPPKRRKPKPVAVSPGGDQPRLARGRPGQVLEVRKQPGQ